MKNKFIRVELVGSATTSLYTYPGNMSDETVKTLVQQVYSENDDFEIIDEILENNKLVCIDNHTIVEIVS